MRQFVCGSTSLRLALVVLCAALGGACHHDGDGANDRDGGAVLGDSGLILVITPQNPMLVLQSGAAPPTQQFSASINGQSVPATWSTDRAELGSIDSAGVYRPLGTLGGKGIITASYLGLTATTTITLQYKLVENGDPACGMMGPIGPGGYGGVGGNGPGCTATDPQKTALASTPMADASLRWLYPYDATVFPRGLLAPLLMWDPGAHDFDALRLQMTAKGGTFVYDGTFSKPQGKPFINLPIPQATWTAMNYSASGDEVTVVVTLAQGDKAYGPITLKWIIAAATLKGIVYYNSYGTALVTNSGEHDFNMHDFGAGTLGIKPGKTDPVLIAGKSSSDNSGCRVCHSVSKDGSRLITQHGADYQTSSLYDLKANNAQSALMAGNSAFPAMFPDGSKFFTSAGGMLNGDSASQLYDLPAGTLTQGLSGLPADLQASLPAFSPDGTQLVFNHYGGAGADQKSLATMSFDLAGKAFGPVQKLITPANDKPAIWPSFLPTNKGVVYEVELETHEWGFTRSGNRGALHWVDVASKQAHALDKLNGVGYLPTGMDHMADAELNYEPTVNPVPSGGYAWVVFTSRRMYGNVATIDPFTSDPRDYDWKNQITTKKLWVAAIDLNAAAGSDPSHPAFYLPAQELHAGNSRGFWTVDPCRMDGSSCETGDECCGGYCQPSGATDGGTGLVCSSNKPACAKEYERCVTSADCCGNSSTPSIDPGGSPSLSCINGYCVANSPPIL